MRPSGLAWANRILLTALSVMTGAVKLAQMEEEMALFRTIGFSDGITMGFGALQLAGGLLLLRARTTKAGAWLMAPTFLFATGVLFANAMVPFGVASVLFIAMAVFHAMRWPTGDGR
ncbi:MAG: DoxX family protein [Nannocystales bacterium]